MASLRPRVSTSSICSSGSESSNLPKLVVAPNADSEEWIRSWESTPVKGAPQPVLASPHLTRYFHAALIDASVVDVDGDVTVEEACDVS
jgi:hypothetical protein